MELNRYGIGVILSLAHTKCMLSPFKSLAKISCIIFWMFGAVAEPAKAYLGVQSASRENINQNVFRINGTGAPGSGVLVILPDRKAAVLTSKHVVMGLGKSEAVEIVFTPSLSLEVTKDKIIDVPGMDLSILIVDRAKLEKSKETFIASMVQPDGIVRGQAVTVAGYPTSGNSISDTIRISPGVIQTVSDGRKSDGYDIGYSSQTYVGMSGGALLSNAGLLVGIHGRGEAISSSDANKTGTNYAVSIKKIFDYYRNRSSSTSASTSAVVEASRQILFGDYAKATTSWAMIAERYPESFIARYNYDCLRSRLGQQRLDKNKYPLLFEKVHSQISVINPYFMGVGPGVAYLNDPLVKLYRPVLKPDDPMYDSWEMAFLSVLIPVLELIRDPASQKYKFPDLQNECILLSLAKYEPNTAKYMPPFMPTPYIVDTIRP